VCPQDIPSSGQNHTSKGGQAFRSSPAVREPNLPPFLGIGKSAFRPDEVTQHPAQLGHNERKTAVETVHRAAGATRSISFVAELPSRQRGSVAYAPKAKSSRFERQPNEPPSSIYHTTKIGKQPPGPDIPTKRVAEPPLAAGNAVYFDFAALSCFGRAGGADPSSISRPAARVSAEDLPVGSDLLSLRGRVIGGIAAGRDGPCGRSTLCIHIRQGLWPETPSDQQGPNLYL
jgi:hypothetical protein